MTSKNIYLFIICCLFTASCAKTTVVLVPDPDGKVGEVTVGNLISERTLTKSEESVTSGNYILPASGNEVLDKEQVKETFQPTLNSEPEVPLQYVLYFKSGSVELSDEASAMLPESINAAKKKNTCDIILIGHTDTMGDSEYNIKLSLRRATTVQQELINSGIEKKCIKIRSYGEHDPIVKSGDNKSEPKNRRVEFIVR